MVVVEEGALLAHVRVATVTVEEGEEAVDVAGCIRRRIARRLEPEERHKIVGLELGLVGGRAPLPGRVDIRVPGDEVGGELVLELLRVADPKVVEEGHALKQQLLVIALYAHACLGLAAPATGRDARLVLRLGKLGVELLNRFVLAVHAFQLLRTGAPQLLVLALQRLDAAKGLVHGVGVRAFF